MEVKIRNIVLLISVLIVLIIFVDLIFNLSGVVMEKFESNPPNFNRQNNDTIDVSKVKSIVSKHDGRLFNIALLPNDPLNETMVIPSPVSTNSNISVNTDGTLSESLKMSTNIDQRFKLKKVGGSDDLEQLSKHNINFGANSNSNCTDYPFYMIQSEKYTDWALAYEPGRLYLAPIGNYNNQKWDVSNISNPNKSILTHNVNNNSYGALNKNGNSAEGEVHDPNKIKINLNLTDELKKQIFGESVGKTSNGDDQGSTSDFYKQKCDRYISGDAIESICPGCDTDKL